MRLLPAVAFALLLGCSAPPERSLPAALDSAETLTVLEDMDGARHDLAAALQDGRGVAFIFWQTWCASCLREAPGLVRAARDLDGSIDFYGIVSGPDRAVDDDEVRRIVERFETPYPQIRDRELTLTRRFDVKGTPTIVVLDADGRIAYYGHEPPATWPAP